MPGFSVFGLDAQTIVERALLVVVILVVTLVAARLVSRLFVGYLRRHPEALPSASLITTLASIAMRCLLKDAAARYQTGRELADALLEYLHETNARSPERVRMVRAKDEDRDAKQESTSPKA